MARVHNFSAGPAALPASVLAEVAAELVDYRGLGMSVLEMSHRSPAYREVIDDAEAALRRLLGATACSSSRAAPRSSSPASP